MRIFLDTANIDEIRQAAKLGVISGVTTNPSLIAKENSSDLKSVIQEIVSIVNGPISAEVLSSGAKGMIEEAQDIPTWSSNVVVKVPISTDGLEAASVFTSIGVKTNLTLCSRLIRLFWQRVLQVISARVHHPLHCVASGKAGAHYVHCNG